MLGGVTDSLGPRVLFCAFAEVPGATAAGTRMAQWLSVFGTKEMDALSLKGRSAVHLQRFGGARMMRVPNTEGRPLPEGLATYQRALQRQMNGENYHLVWCADLESAASVAPLLKGFWKSLTSGRLARPCATPSASPSARRAKCWYRRAPRRSF